MVKKKVRALLLASIVLVVLLLGFSWKYVYTPVCVAYVTGTSMVPTIKAGSLAIGIYSRPQVGDIVIAEINGKHVIHRVVFTNTTHILTKGDANPNTDTPIKITHVKCVVIAVIPPTIFTISPRNPIFSANFSFYLYFIYKYTLSFACF